MLSNIGGKYKLCRRGRKLIMADDARTLMALPKDVPERIWYFIPIISVLTLLFAQLYVDSAYKSR